MEHTTLNNGVKMPMAGIGTFLLTPDEAEASCVSALQNGYRLIDTANAYVNEKAVGRAMKKSGLQREEIFLETKLWPSFYEQPDAVDKTLARLDTPYIDLLLIHQPAGNYVDGYYSKMIQSHNGWMYCGVYSDEAVTGTKRERAGFQHMIEECRQGNIDLVITKSISRFARNTVTLLQTVRELKSLGVDVFFEEQHIHTQSSDGELMMTILASYAQEESLSASENQKWRVRKAFENGEIINLRFLFGYDITPDGIRVNEVDAAIVREIFARFNGGESMSSICRDLDARGHKGVLGGTWCAERMRNTLSNEKYLGNALLQKRYRNNHIEKKLLPNRGELPMYYAEGTHEPIIDQATFDKAQERLRMLAQQAANRKKPTRSVFSGLIHCGLCGNTYKRVTYRKKHYWNCTTFQTKGKSECAAKRIPEETLEVLTCEVLGAVSFDPDMVRSKITAIRAEKNNVVVFCMDDGSEIVKRWADRSRVESWTPEMKEQARQRALQARRHKL